MFSDKELGLELKPGTEEQDPMHKIHANCKVMFAITKNILIHSEKDSDEDREKLQALSQETIIAGRKLMIAAAELAEQQPTLAKQIYEETNIAKLAVLDAIQLAEVKLHAKVLKDILKAIPIPNKPTGSLN